MGTLSARDWDDEWRGHEYQRQDLRHDYRDLRGDYARVSAMRADIARDRARLNEVFVVAAKLRQQKTPPIWRATNAHSKAQLRDIRHDQRDIDRDEQSYQRWR